MQVTLVHYIDDFIAATRLDHEASIQLVGSKNSSWLGVTAIIAVGGGQGCRATVAGRG